MRINYGNFDTVQSVIRSGIFLIPTFQRPYAWDKVNLTDLFDDVRAAANGGGGIHYVSPLHVIKINNCNDTEWVRYTDADNLHISYLNTSQFREDAGSNCDIYLVVDGQQRLTTLYMTFLLLLGPSYFTVTLRDGNTIPRLILNPSSDHYKFCEILGINAPLASTHSKAQSRLAVTLDELKSLCDGILEPEKNVLLAGLKTILIELNANYALKGFLSLNSRGKRLTYFEMLKSQFMELDYRFGDHGDSHRIHDIFSKAYLALDSSYPQMRWGRDYKSLFNDDEFLALLSLDIFRVSEILNEGGEKIFLRYRSETARPAREQLQDDWLPKLESLATQVIDLNGRMNSRFAVPEESYNDLGRSVADHYKAVIDFLNISKRSIAFALKLRAVHNVELHEKIYPVAVNNRETIGYLISEAAHLKGELENFLNKTADLNEAETLVTRLRAIESELQTMALHPEQPRTMSILDLCEWIELFIVQMDSRRDYITSWNAAFLPGMDAREAFTNWTNFATAYAARHKFFICLSTGLASPGNRKIVEYVLYEYESKLRRSNIGVSQVLPHQEKLDLEHFMPTAENIHVLEGYGIKDYNEYISVNSSLGNLLLLDSGLNRALRNELPEIKIHAYGLGVFKNTQATVKTEMSLSFGCQGLDKRLYNLSISIRRLEILTFAINRF